MILMKVQIREVFKRIIPYLLAILVMVGANSLLWIFRDDLRIQVLTLLFLLPVVLVTRLWGLGPGILSALYAFLSFNYFFIPPFYTFQVHQYQDLLALIVFLVVAVVISQLLGHDQASIAAVVAREREATQLYELSVALARLMNEQPIATILAEKICETFRAEKVEVVLPSFSGEKVTAQAGEVADGRKPRRADYRMPLLTARGQQGFVYMWRDEQPLSQSEERLLSTFTSQGALAIERAILVQKENRAKVFEESDRLKSALLSSVSHELRTPLATIKASISSLHSGLIDWDTEARQDLLAAVEEETDHLNQLVGNLLDMTRIETGALNPQRKWNSLSEICGGVIKRMHPLLQNHRVEVEIPPDTSPVPVDYVQIEQVFSNLISNSIKYAPQGTAITVRSHPLPDKMILVQVINEGPPVPEESLERIFDKFYRITFADQVTGTGLGLSICKGIIEAHGGRIWAENVPGHFIFNFTLPMTWAGDMPQVPKEE